MQLSRAFRPIVLAVTLTLALVLPASARNIANFSFIHMSDAHAPHDSGPTIAEMAGLGRVEMVPYGITAAPPSFIIDTGDMMEFSPHEGSLETLLGWFKDVKIPVYRQSGNHDGTWNAIRRELRQWHGSHAYSFSYNGCLFIGLDSSSVQDPRPTFTREQFLWLDQRLQTVDPDTPIFLFFHHPARGGEFASQYEWDILFDMLRPYNVIAFLTGHSHNFRHTKVSGFDQIGGGSPFGPNMGFSIVNIADGVVTAAYKRRGEPHATERIMQKPLMKQTPYPVITIASPERGKTYTGNVPVRATITGNPRAISEAAFTISGSEPRRLTFSQPNYTAAIDGEALLPGAHYIRITLTDRQGNTYERSTHFYAEHADSRVVWRAIAGGSFKEAAAVTRDTVYAGATDGKLYAYNRADGRLKWTYETGAEIIAQPLVIGDTIYFGCGNDRLHAVGTDGKRKWVFKAGRSVYSPPVQAGELVIFGANDSKLYALNAQTGRLVWANDDQKFTIESKPFVHDNTVYFGSWDEHVYAVDIRTGNLKWKTRGHGSATMPASRYYSPADCGPVVLGGKVYIADRHFSLSIIDAETGEMTGHMENVSATGLSQDGKFVYLRRTDGNLTKLDEEGQVVWNARSVGGDIMPVPPAEHDGIVFIASRQGHMRAVNAENGRILWEYQVTPGMFIKSRVEAYDGTAYVTGMDGSITAFRMK